MAKYAIVVLAPPEDEQSFIEGMAYAETLYEDDHDIEVYFEGLGTKWIPKLDQLGDDNRAVELYDSMEENGLVKGVCRYCAAAYDVDKTENDNERDIGAEVEVNVDSDADEIPEPDIDKYNRKTPHTDDLVEELMREGFEIVTV